jgi:hypothetical protein
MRSEAMSSEWLSLTSTTNKRPIYVNLANASSIFSNGKGSDIWFISDAGKEGKIQVDEPPEVILTRLNEVKRATGHK